MYTMMRKSEKVTSRESSSASSGGSGLWRSGRYAAVFVCWVGLSFATPPMLAQNFDPLRLRLNTPGNDGGPAKLFVAAASAERPTRDSNCVHPSSGVSFNELFGVPEQFVNPICPGLTAGEHWRPTISYFGADASTAVYPPGYVPLYANPVDDILAKVTLVVVIDGGTSQQKTYTFFPTDADAFRTDVRIHDLNPAFPDIPSFFIIPRMAPLSPGHHTHQLIWVQSAPHCDGLSADEDSCLPAGAFPVNVRAADVAIP
jgi:hypothetical protein